MENTPARIISTQTHGMGIQYRNAFRNTQVVFEEYDGLFATGKYNIDLNCVAEMALSRLRYPFSLEEKAKEDYAAWLAEHLQEAAFFLLEEQDMGSRRWLAETFAADLGQMELLLSEAKRQEAAEAVSMLMDVRRRRFPAGKKRFCL